MILRTIKVSWVADIRAIPSVVQNLEFLARQLLNDVRYTQKYKLLAEVLKV